MVLIYEIVFTVLLVVGSLLIAIRLPRRNYFWIRAISCIVVLAGFTAIVEVFATQIITNLGTAVMLSKYIIKYIMVVFGIWICFECNFMWALFCGTVGYCMEHLKTHVYYFIRNAFTYSWPIWANEMINFILTAAIFLFVYFVIIKKNRNLYANITAGNGIQIISAAVVVSICAYLSSYMAIYAVMTDSRPLLLMIYAMVVITMTVTLILEFTMLFSKKRQSQIKELENILKEQYKQYELEKANTEQINLKIHDLKHQIKLMSGHQDSKFLQELQDAVEIVGSFVNTGNEAIDTVITKQSMYCRQKGIIFKCVLDASGLDYIPPHEIYALFGNAIENAIYAVEKMATERRIISISCIRKQDLLNVRIVNFFNGDIVFNGNLPVTQKDKDLHGFGMRSMQFLSEKYGGRINANTDGAFFILDIFLPLNIVE